MSLMRRSRRRRQEDRWLARSCEGQDTRDYGLAGGTAVRHATDIKQSTCRASVGRRPGALPRGSDPGAAPCRPRRRTGSAILPPATCRTGTAAAPAAAAVHPARPAVRRQRLPPSASRPRAPHRRPPSWDQELGQQWNGGPRSLPPPPGLPLFEHQAASPPAVCQLHKAPLHLLGAPHDDLYDKCVRHCCRTAA